MAKNKASKNKKPPPKKPPADKKNKTKKKKTKENKASSVSEKKKKKNRDLEKNSSHESKKNKTKKKKTKENKTSSVSEKKKDRKLRDVLKAKKDREISKRRKEERERKKIKKENSEDEGTRAFCFVKKTMTHLFPAIFSMLLSITDIRGKNKVYSLLDVTLSVILHFAMRGGTLNDFDNNRIKSKKYSENIQNVFGIKTPSASTVSRILKWVPPFFLEKIFKYMFSELNKKKFLDRFAITTGYIVVSIDASTFNKSDIFYELSIKKSSKRGKITYQRSALVAKICLSNGVTIPIAIEWLTTKDGDNKEDCEQNAFKRMAPKLAKILKGRKVFIVGDGLYANEPVIEICEKYIWEYSLSIKDKQNKKTWDQAHDLLEISRETKNNEMAEKLISNHKKNSKKKKKIKYIDQLSVETENIMYKDKNEVVTKAHIFLEGLKHQGRNINFCAVTVFKGTVENHSEKVFFSFITSSGVDEHNVKKIVSAARLGRSMIENSFNNIKNRGFKGAHKFSRFSGVAAQNFMFLMLIGETINSLISQCDEVQVGMMLHSNNTLKALWEDVISEIKKIHISIEKFKNIEKTFSKNFYYNVMNGVYIS